MTNPNEVQIYNILANAQTIAIVGASNKPDRPVHGVMKMLLDAGYRVIPVNPNEGSVLGQTAYPSLADIPEPVDIVNVFRRAEATPPIAEAAVSVGAGVLWLQLGIASPEAERIARAGGLQVIMDKCIAVEHRLLRVPRVVPAGA